MVDALKRVTEKLRGENERLRRAAGDGSGRAEAERSARHAKKRAAALRAEVESLTVRAKEADGAVSKLAQKQVLQYMVVTGTSHRLLVPGDDGISFPCVAVAAPLMIRKLDMLAVSAVRRRRCSR